MRARVHCVVLKQPATHNNLMAGLWSAVGVVGGVSQCFGGHSVRETPGYIPNPEAKPHSADGTAGGTLWESRTPPNKYYEKPRTGYTGTGLFCISGLLLSFFWYPGTTVTAMSSFVIRSVRVDEWRAAKGLRLSALRDPLAQLAFLETYEDAVGRPDSFWQERVQRGAEGATGAQQIIAEGPDGEWVGGLVVLVEEPGTTDWAGFPVVRKQGHIVGVFMLPEHRGCGLTDVLFDAALEWAWGVAEVERVRLIVHQDNARAQRFYRRVGFLPSGVTVALSEGSEDAELEFVLERELHP